MHRGHHTLACLLGLSVLAFCGCPRVNWNETYRYDRKDPFDLYALYQLLDGRPQRLICLRDSSDLERLDTVTGSNYLFVGSHPYYEEAAVTQLLDYVERGNTAFLASRDVPEDLAYHLFGDACYYEAFAEPTLLSAEYRFPEVQADSVIAYRYPAGDSFHLVNIRHWEPALVYLNVIDDRLLCDPEFDQQVLGSLDTSGVNFMRLGWGKGNFYVHTNPIFFTNWFLVDSLQYRYAEAALSVIAEGPVYWDEYHRRYRQPPLGSPLPADPEAYTGGRNLLSGNQTLLYIQQHRALALAWYTLLAGVVLFTVFRGRRRQRIIPVIAPRENSSRRLIASISRLMHEKGNHRALAQRELKSLRFYLNHRYGIHWVDGQPPPENLVERTGLPRKVVAEALAQIRVASAGKPLAEKDLLRFYRAIEPLYGS